MCTVTKRGRKMKRPENEKTRELTQKLYDKSIKGEERRRLADELAKERYRLDKRKPMSHKASAVGSIVFGVLAMALGAVYFIGISHSADMNGGSLNTDTFCYMIYGLILLMMIGVSVASTFFKKEPDDEMSRYDKCRAASNAAPATMAFGTLLYLFLDTYTGDIQFGKEVLFVTLLFISGMYMVIAWAGFLVYEMKSGSTEDE